jgi:hypothetical protein
VSWPQNLDLMKMSDGGVCLSPDAAVLLKNLRVELEAL